MLVASNPKLNVNPGVLYQYDTAAADRLKAMDPRSAPNDPIPMKTSWPS